MKTFNFQHHSAPEARSITAAELQAWLDARVDFQLIDVRELYEYDRENLGGELIPLATLFAHVDRIDHLRTVVLISENGARSARAAEELQRRFGFRNLYSLDGGIIAYRQLRDRNLAAG